MSNKRTKADEVLNLARRLGVLGLKDLTKKGIHPEHLRRLYQQGALERVGRGLYRLADADVTEYATMVMVAKQFPHGIICLLSALRFHGIGTQNPREVWVAFRRGTAIPQNTNFPVRFMSFSDASFSAGIEEHVQENVPVRVTCPAKTISDCFKYRNKVGLDVSIEALREALRSRKCNVDDLWHYAKVCRVRNIIRPYLEAVL